MSNTGATGFTSNYNDSGYIIPSTINGMTAYGINNVNISNTNIPSSDLYTNTQTVGVYMINGSPTGTSNAIYPVYCSTSNVLFLGVPSNADEAYIVYPGYGLQLFQSNNYGLNETNVYTNNTTSVQIFYVGTNTDWDGTQMLQPSGSSYNNNSTNSIKIWFRCSEILITCFS
jgi:hypothetical protein